MVLAESTWQEIEATSRERVVLIPTGSLEQHGPHLPLFTDSILVTAVAADVERRIPEQVLLTPTLWLGASGHHLRFPGTLSASFEAYERALLDVIESLLPHGFTKFFVLNGHGGNTEPNGVALRTLKARHPNLQLGHAGYFSFLTPADLALMQGPLKGIRHACEAETSLMLHVRPDLVRMDRLRNDGLVPEPEVVGMIHHFDEQTEEGSWGDATYAEVATGAALFHAAVGGVAQNLARIAEGYVLKSRSPETAE